MTFQEALLEKSIREANEDFLYFDKSDNEPLVIFVCPLDDSDYKNYVNAMKGDGLDNLSDEAAVSYSGNGEFGLCGWINYEGIIFEKRIHISSDPQ